MKVEARTKDEGRTKPLSLSARGTLGENRDARAPRGARGPAIRGTRIISACDLGTCVAAGAHSCAQAPRTV
eukprot:scaffold98699_cov69-Phaeocystis_antarctica.AAC.3